MKQPPLLLLETFVWWSSFRLLFAEAAPHSFALDPVRLSQQGFLPAKSIHRSLEFGDFAEDIPEECPATTTCPVVCRANATDCPTLCDDGLTLCSTGNCESDCTVHDSMYENPCSCESLSVACPKTIDLYPDCYDRFQIYYDNNTACLKAQLEEVTLLSFTGPWFLACYFELASVSLLVVLWCFFNQKLAPVQNSTMPLHSADHSVNDNNNDFMSNDTSGLLSNRYSQSQAWTQTGYRTGWIGWLIYLLVNFTFWAIQFLLFLLTLFYYMQQEAITRWKPVFEDEIQVLKAFQIVWMVGIVWCLAFRYPSTGIRALFLRRCELRFATHVAVVAPIKSIAVLTQATSPVGRIASNLWYPVDLIFRTIFSHPYDRPGMETLFCPVEKDKFTGTLSILHRVRRYVYDEESQGYVPSVIKVGKTLGDLLDQQGGLSLETVEERRGRAGPNIIPLQKPTILGSIFKEFSKTFYIYQNFMVWSWANFFYYYMAIVNTFVRITGGLVVAYFQYNSDKVLYQLSHVDGEIEVLRGGVIQVIPVAEAVPGDVLVIRAGEVYCDLVILKGSRILMDESALTGESTPVLKLEVDPKSRHIVYDESFHSLHTISAGTEVLEVDANVNCLGLVMQTGSFTSKGEILTEVLSYERHKFKFDDEVKLVLCILVVEAAVLVSLAFVFLNDEWVFSWFYGAFILGTVIPPLLPTVFVVSVGISANRLQSKRISCTYPGGVLIAGKVDTAFFDKTGTLTNQGMDFLSVDCGSDETTAASDKISLGMAVCHTLSLTNNGEIVGNQVDKASFEATGADIRDGNKIVFRGKVYTVVKQFAFDCHRATQSVIVEGEDGHKEIFAKGSPDAMKRLCEKSSLPDDFDRTVRESAKSGVYQIVLAFRRFDNENTKLSDVYRDDVEKYLRFGGFVNFQNSLRQEAPTVLKDLEDGAITTAMITGDSVLTGICIARESGMIRSNRTVLVGRMVSDTEIEWADFDSDVVMPKPSETSLEKRKRDLAISGEAWTLLCESDPKYASLISRHVRVFGRCKPGEKVSVVATFVSNGYTTLMCGDGRNDCGGLKTAHVGIALSSSEASVVAPFTSLDKSLSSVTEVLREGRCALASAFSAYSFYIIYGQTESFLQVINAYLSITFTEWCWVFLDGIWSVTLAFSLPLAKAAKKLTPRRPTDSLLGPETMYSVCGILAWNFLFLVIALFALFQQDWFQCRKWNSEDVSNVLAIGDNYEASVIFIVGGYQYIASAMVLNFGYTFRQGWIRNYTFVFLSVTWSLFIFVMTIYPSSFSCIWRVNCDNENAVRWVTVSYPVAIINPFNTTVMPVSFRWTLVGIMVTNFITIACWQYYFVNSIVARKQDEATTKYRIRKSMSNVDATGSTMEMEIKFAEQKHAKLK